MPLCEAMSPSGTAAAASLVAQKAAKAEPEVPEGDIASHKGMKGDMSYHGYDEDWHTEYKGDVHHGAHPEQKEAFKKDFLHKEYSQNGPSDFAGLSSVAALCAVALLNA